MVVTPLKSTPPLNISRLTRTTLTCLVIGLPLESFSKEQKASASPEQRIEIAAASLSQVLSNFAAAQGVALIYDTRLTEGLSSPGLQGEYSLYEGF